MIVVADSSPFVVLIAIGHVKILTILFGRVTIPPEVAAELGSPARPESVRAFITAPPAWLQVRAPTFVESIPGLHAGEAAAVALARELQADRLIIDEAKGRKAANERGLPIIGTVGVLELAASRMLLDLSDTFDDVKRTDFWVNPKFLDERLALFLEKQSRGESSGD
jgi:predicted nucleic acid-binding protein